MSITTRIARKLRTVTGLLTLGTVADGEYLRRSGTTVVGGPGGAAGIGGSTGATDNAILRANGTGGATLQAGAAVTLEDSGEIRGGDGTAALPTFGNSNQRAGMFFAGGGYYPHFSVNGGVYMAIGNGNYASGPQLTSVGGIGWSPTGDPLAGTQTTISSPAAGVVQVGTDANNAAGHLKAASIRGTAVAFASLPASPVEGMLVGVTDSNTNTWGATIAGGGANHVLAYYNGTNWTVAGK